MPVRGSLQLVRYVLLLSVLVHFFACLYYIASHGQVRAAKLEPATRRLQPSLALTRLPLASLAGGHGWRGDYLPYELRYLTTDLGHLRYVLALQFCRRLSNARRIGVWHH